MPIYELTLQAESDIRDIIRYTLERHGEKQALCYKNAMQKNSAQSLKEPSIPAPSQSAFHKFM